MKEYFPNYGEQEAYRIARLIAGFLRGTLSRTEHLELDDWVAASDENMQLFERLTDEKNLAEATKWMESVETEKALQEKKKNIVFNRPATGKLWLRFIPYAVAASVIIVVGLIIFKPFSGNKPDNSNSVTTSTNDILPGGNKAVLTLANGEKVILDSTADGSLTMQGNTTITKSDGQLRYVNTTGTDEPLYNTISTPNGGQYKLTLSDGSKVWLNAASSIYYPVAFAVNERIVTITGEAYFEIAKDAAKPFKVKVNDAVVEVLGTHFNVNAYTNEPVIRTTLAEGSVKVSTKTTKVILAPGQEAQLNQQGEIKTTAANLEETLAWKDGQFLFKDAPIENIMRQVERWYDADVVYENKPADHFNVELSRNVPVSKMLRFLELTNRVHFKIENKKIVVSK